MRSGGLRATRRGLLPLELGCRTDCEVTHVGTARRIFERLRRWSRRRRFREGAVVSRFIARDVRRDILIVSAARIDEGVVRGRVRTTNVLYVHKGLVAQPEYGPATDLPIDELWRWDGRDWGGLPDGTSIVVHATRRTSGTAEEEGVD